MVLLFLLRYECQCFTQLLPPVDINTEFGQVHAWDASYSEG